MRSLERPRDPTDPARMSEQTRQPHQHLPHGLDVPAGVCAMLFPGLGHFVRGEPRRAIYAAIGVLGMFLGGMLIGGIDTIDSREDKWWFYGQAFVGPLAFGADWYHQHQLKAYGIPYVRNENTGDEGYLTSDRELDPVRGPHRPRSLYPHERREMVEVTVFRGPGGKRETRTLPVAVPANTDAGEVGAPPNGKGIAKVNEIGTLYALCAGMLNLIVILDALFPTIRPKAKKAAPRASADRDNPAQPKPAPGSPGDPRVAAGEKEGGADA